jgi:hypothetical protein
MFSYLFFSYAKFFRMTVFQDIIKTLKVNPDGSLSSHHAQLLNSFISLLSSKSTPEMKSFFIFKNLTLAFEKFQ